MPPPLGSMDEIERKMGASISWNRPRVKFLARFLVALIGVKTVCLTQIASAFPGEADPASHYKRIQRFLRGFEIDYSAIARLVAGLVGAPAPWVLAMDRTNWKLGRTEINVLMLALVYRGIAFPLVWTLLPRAGNSNTTQRIDLLERFVRVFGAGCIAFVCADREFASEGLLRWLVHKRVHYRLRIKSDTLLSNAKGGHSPAGRFFANCPRERERPLPGQRECLGQHVHVAGTRLAAHKRDEYLIVISDEVAPLSDYALRWGVETLFGARKSRGFCLEATHVVAGERLSKLLALLAIAFCWAFACGVWLTEQAPARLKKHGRPPVSVFRSGLDWLRRVLLPLCGAPCADRMDRALAVLSCT